MSEETGRLGGPKNIRDPLFVSREAADRSSHEIYEFGPFRLEPAERKLLRDGVIVALTPKVFDMLVMLVRNSNHLLDKEELIRSLWPDSFVEEGNLSNNIFVLRKALGNDHEYIETVPRRGYRFVGAVRQLPATGQSTISGPLEAPRREVSSNQRLPTGKIVFLAIAVASLVLAAIFIFWRFKGPAAGSPSSRRPLALEQRLTANPPDVPVNNAVVSPDGKFLAYGDPTGLYLRQISNGETRPWSLPKGFFATPKSWFPDSTHLLVVRIERPSYDGGWDPSRWKPSLYKISVMGGEPQGIKSDARSGYVSPDGSRIAYLTILSRTELWIIDSDGGNSRRLVPGDESNKRANTDWIYPVAWSPDGKHLAYIVNHSLDAPYPVAPTHSLRIIGPNGDGAAVVLDDARIGPGLWWAPDGRILFSYREGSASTKENYGVYSIRLDEHAGKATGPPQQITLAEGDIGGISGTADGKQFVLWRYGTTTQAFISRFDSGSHQWAEPRRLTLDSNENVATAWTADSKAVLFVSNRNGMWKLFKQAIDETTPEELTEGRSISIPRLSADGTQVLYLSSSNPEDVSFPASIMSKPLAGGAPRIVMQGKGIFNIECARAPSTLCVLDQGHGNDVDMRSFDMEHGAGGELLKLHTANGNWGLSSDGSKVAVILDQHRIRFHSIATEAANDVTVKDWPLGGVDWGASGQTVFVSSSSPSGLPVILEIDQKGNARVVLQGRPDARFTFMIQSPDSRYALLGEDVSTDNNAWIVNDF